MKQKTIIALMTLMTIAFAAGCANESAKTPEKTPDTGQAVKEIEVEKVAETAKEDGKTVEAATGQDGKHYIMSSKPVKEIEPSDTTSGYGMPLSAADEQDLEKLLDEIEGDTN